MQNPEPVNWFKLRSRAGNKQLKTGLQQKELKEFWNTYKQNPPSWDIVDRYLLGKKEYLAKALEHNVDRIAASAEYDRLYTHTNIPTFRYVFEIATTRDFYALKGRYRVTYNDEIEEVYFTGGKKNVSQFFLVVSDTEYSTELGKNIKDGNYSGVKFEYIDNRLPDQTQALRDAQRYNELDYHCVWTPIVNYYKNKLESTKSKSKHEISKINSLIRYYKELADGPAVTKEQIQKICDQKNIKIVIEYVGFDDNTTLTLQKHPITQVRNTFKYVCVYGNHLEYQSADMYKIIVLNKNDFFERLKLEPQIHPVRLRNPERGEIIADKKWLIYSFDSYKEQIRYVMDIYSSLLDEKSEASKFLKWATKNFSIPDELPVYKLIKCSLHNPSHCALPEYLDTEKPKLDKDELYGECKGKIKKTEQLYSTDAEKAYAKFRLNRFYRGAPGKLHDWMYNPPKEIYLEYAGYWFIRTDHNMKFYPTPLTGCWGTIALQYFTSIGIEFTVEYGAWSYDWIDIPDFHEDIAGEKKKMYAILIGMLQRDGNREITEKWIDPEKLLDDGIGIKSTKKKISTYNKCMLAVYYLDYAWTRIHEMALKYDAIAIKTDAIITKDPVPDTYGWHECKPYVADDTTYPEYFLNDKMTSEFIDPTPEKFKYTYEHDLRNISGNIYLSGAGGTGKTTAVLDQYDYIGCLYTSLCKEQVERFKNAGTKYCTNIHNINRQRWIPGVILVDEVSQLSLGNDKAVATIEGIVNVNEMHKIIFAGDRAQISIMQSHSDESPNAMWDYLETLHKFEFTTLHRAKDDKYRQLLTNLRQIVLSDIPEQCTQNKINGIMAIVKQFKKKPKYFDGMIYGNRSQKEGEEIIYQSIDKVQGETIDIPYCVQINTNTHRASIFHKLVYTGLSRGTLYNNVYVWDISNLKKKKQISEDEICWT